ncbi:MAG: DUF1653 domain-containing protein [Clostridia bacterium]|nr:DUF1653 domain-containing protein [Clostridia bacterium]
MKPELKPLQSDISGVYRHYKGGMYRVLGVARHSETLEVMVVYEPLDGSTGLWVRPASMWNEMVTVDGQEQPRFARVEA